MHGGNVWQGGSPQAWLDFSANLRPGGAPEWVREALREAGRNISYYPDPEMTLARAGLAAHLGLDAACVLPTAGGISALALAMRLPFSEALLPVPCFSEYAPLAQIAGHPVLQIPLWKEGRELSLAEALPDPLPRGSLICVGNPINPLGVSPGRATLEALLKRAEEAGGWLLADEAFIDYCPEHSLRDLIPSHPRLLIAGSLTKILGIPGARLGYLCGHPETLASLHSHQLTWELNCFADAIARALPDHGEDLLQEARRNRLRRAGMRKELEDLGIKVYPSEASFLLVRTPSPAGRMAEGLRGRGLLVRECMDYPGLADGHYLRLAVREKAEVRRLTGAIREVIACAENH